MCSEGGLVKDQTFYGPSLIAAILVHTNSDQLNLDTNRKGKGLIWSRNTLLSSASSIRHLLVETLEVAAETKPGDGLTPLCPFLAMP